MYINVRDIRGIQQQQSELSNYVIRNLTDTMMLGKKEQLRSDIHKILSSMKGVSYSALKVNIMKIVMSVQDAVVQRRLDCDEVRLDEWLDFILALSDCPSIETFECRFNALFDKVLEGIDTGTRAKDMRFASIMAEVEQIIETEYHDSNLTPESIALKLNMSPEYFKKIYRSNSGTALSEEINRYRLEKAAKSICAGY